MGVVKSLESLLLILLLIATVCKHFVDASVIQANGVPSPFLEFALHSITDLGLTNSNWKFLSGDYNGDGVVDMYCIKQQGVSSTEVHILDGASNFKSYLLHAGSGLHVSNSKDFDFALGDYNKDGKLDLWAVRKTASTTEIHILNGATSFSNFLLHTTTALHRTNENWVFDVTDFNADGKMDMVCVNMRGAIGTEVHILDGASGFKAFNLHARTPIGFASSDAWAFLVSDYNGDKKPDIYGILKNGASGTTEVHVLDGAKSFNSFLVQYPTVLHPTGSEWQFQAADYDRDGKNEILCINTFHAGTSTSLHFIRAGTIGNYWSDASIWSGRIIPSESDLAIIPVGRNVILDIPGKVHSLEIGGRLIVADKVGLSLTSSWVVVYDGELQIGTEDVPYINQFLLKLTGQDRNEVYASSYGVKGDNAFLMVQGNKGKLNIHGSSRNKLSWTQLAATLNVGVNSITLKEPVNWSVGDLIVISSTDFDMNQAETFSITKISGNNRIITLDKAASYIHFGELQVYNNGIKSWTLDERAEVGLLSRNVIIEGSDVAEISNYGGHIIVKGGAFAQIEGCELRKMGQKGIVGKYPFHWHMLGPTTQQYFKSNSIHHTYNRALTIHGTVGVLVERNVAYDHLGHGFFLEDGSEYGNSLINNLGLVTRMMAENEATIPTDFTHVSTYWLTNPNNTVRGNVAGGSDFGGFWFALPQNPTGESKAQTFIKPIHTGLKEFKDNIGHSNQFSNLAFDGSPNPNSQVLDTGHYSPRNPDGSLFVPIITNFTSYKCNDRGIWIRADTFEFQDIKNGDNLRATFFAYSQTMKDSLIVGRSKNVGSRPNPSQHRGHSIYDGPCGADGVHFSGFSGIDVAIQTNGAAEKSTVHWVRNLSFDNTVPEANKVDFSPAAFKGYMWSSGLRDEDGKLTGRAGSILTPIIVKDPGHPDRSADEKFNAATNAIRRSDWGAWINTGAHFALLRVQPSWAENSAEVIHVTRCGGNSGCQTVTDDGTYNWYYQNPVIVRQDFTYQLSFPKFPKSFIVQLKFVNNDDDAVVKIVNMPQNARIDGGVAVTSLESLRTALSTSYFIDSGHLWVRLIAKGQLFDPKSAQNQPIGMKFSATATVTVTISDVADGKRFNPLATYDSGVDSRGSLAGTGQAQHRGIFTGWDNTINWWDVVSGATGTDDYVDYRLTLQTPQDWRYFQSLMINSVLSGERSNKPYSYHVHVFDIDRGYSFLGVCQTGVCTLPISLIDDNRCDSIGHIIIRVHISFFADLNQQGAFQRVHLYSITLV